jgi:uncharacterized Fe-S cluster protein YjdI
MKAMKEYKQGKLVITWENQKCIHSANCVKGLGEVFKPKEQPWIKTGVATDEQVMKQIDLCPSKALGYRLEE